jgi:septin family protein
MAYRSRGRKQAKKGVQLTIMVVGEYHYQLPAGTGGRV